MSILAAADVLGMSLQWDDDARVEDDADTAMRLMAEGVPLQLLVDIALPLTLIRELYADTGRAARS